MTLDESIKRCRYCRAAKTKKRNKIAYAMAHWDGWTEDYATGYYSFMVEQCRLHRQYKREQVAGDE